jgi:polyferredoxin
MTQFNPLDWKRSRLATALALVVAAAAVGGMIGYHHAWSLIGAERLDPADPYIPVIYQKFTAAWAMGMAAAAALVIYIFEIMRRPRP